MAELSKSWLHRTIIQVCDAYAEGKQTTERAEAIADAYAHAIAEKMREGVVWEATGRADINLFKPEVGTEWEPYTLVDCDGASLEVQGRIVDKNGQRVRVTVKEE